MGWIHLAFKESGSDACQYKSDNYISYETRFRKFSLKVCVWKFFLKLTRISTIQYACTYILGARFKWSQIACTNAYPQYMIRLRTIYEVRYVPTVQQLQCREQKGWFVSSMRWLGLKDRYLGNYWLRRVPLLVTYTLKAVLPIGIEGLRAYSQGQQTGNIPYKRADSSSCGYGSGSLFRIRILVPDPNSCFGSGFLFRIRILDSNPDSCFESEFLFRIRIHIQDLWST